VWEARYRYAPATDAVPERSLGETWDRVAGALASVEPMHRAAWQRAFRKALDDFKFLPAGRILAGAGAATTATLANCFAAGPLEDSIEAIFDRLKECALTMRWGGGIGCDFTPIAPRGHRSPGPLSYLRVWDAMCEAVSASGARRGAMMGTLRCDHPDIEEFIEAKRGGSALRNFNLSVLVTDEFMAALAAGRKWPLSFPCAASAVPSGVHLSTSGTGSGAIVRLVSARELWEKIADAAHAAGEPGVLFIDRINRSNNLYYAEQIAVTNPCAEIPLPAHGACVLGSLNLTAFVREAFSRSASLDFAAIGRRADGREGARRCRRPLGVPCRPASGAGARDETHRQEVRSGFSDHARPALRLRRGAIAVPCCSVYATPRTALRRTCRAKRAFPVRLRRLSRGRARSRSTGRDPRSHRAARPAQ
jgi:ribonucleoside-diphosphate reductase alpha chain